MVELPAFIPKKVLLPPSVTAEPEFLPTKTFCSPAPAASPAVAPMITLLSPVLLRPASCPIATLEAHEDADDIARAPIIVLVLPVIFPR